MKLYMVLSVELFFVQGGLLVDTEVENNSQYWKTRYLSGADYGSQYNLNHGMSVTNSQSYETPSRTLFSWSTTRNNIYNKSSGNTNFFSNIDQNSITSKANKNSKKDNIWWPWSNYEEWALSRKHDSVANATQSIPSSGNSDREKKKKRRRKKKHRKNKKLKTNSSSEDDKSKGRLILKHNSNNNNSTTKDLILGETKYEPISKRPQDPTTATNKVASNDWDNNELDNEIHPRYNYHESIPQITTRQKVREKIKSHRHFDNIMKIYSSRNFTNDINECLIDNGGCEGLCINTPGSYRCHCPDGYKLDMNKCIDINECLLRNGHGPCQDRCINEWGSYKCTCEDIPGTRLAADGHTCEDVDECKEGTVGCSHDCINTIGSAFCLCPSGFILGTDWKTCTDIDECTTPEMQDNKCGKGCENTQTFLMDIEATIMEIPFSKPDLVRRRTPKKRKGSSTLKTNLDYVNIVSLEYISLMPLFTYRSYTKDQDFEELKSVSHNECKRQIHSKIEKRRRDKMNTYISQLSTMIPSCKFSHKIDKITVLRMAVQYLKSIRSSPIQCNSEENLKYSFMSDIELKKLILQVSEGFLFVVGCDSGRILYVSESISTISKCNQNELMGRSLYDVIHPNDIDKVKEQIISCSDLSARHKSSCLKHKTAMKEMVIDLPSEQLGLHPGNRRSFFFRFKSDVENSGKYTYGMNNVQFYKSMDEITLVNSTNCNPDQNEYCVIHCVGYLKCWNPINNIENPKDCEDVSPLTCLIAIGRSTNNSSQSLENEKPSKFISKYTVDGKFLYVDHWFTLITGFLPQEVLGTSIYEYIHSEDVNEFAEAHRSMLQPFNYSNTTKNYRFCAKFGNFINVRSEWKTLLNPWKKDVEYFYSKNMVKWPSNQTSDEKKPNEKTSDLIHNELFSFSNYTSEERHEQALIDDFNFHHSTSDKNANEATMEAILKLLESDTCISN